MTFCPRCHLDERRQVNQRGWVSPVRYRRDGHCMEGHMPYVPAEKRSSHHSLPDHVCGVVAAPLQVLWEERVVQMEPECTPLGEGHVCNGPSHKGQLTSCSEEKAIDQACSTARVSGKGRLSARSEDGRAERGVGRCWEREGERALGRKREIERGSSAWKRE